MKKLHFIRANKSKHGGAEVYLSRLSDELKKQNIKHQLVHSGIPKFLPSWLKVLLFNKKVCKAKTKNDLYFSLERISCADIYRAGDGVHKVFVNIAKKSHLNPLHKVYIYLEEKCFKNAKKIIANSHMIKQQIIDTYDIKPEKIEVVYNGIKLEKPDFDSSLEKIHNEFGIDKQNGQKVIVYVGSGFKRKGVKEFLAILSKLQYTHFKAFVVGKEKKMQYYKNLAKELKLEDKVIFTGARDDVKDFYTVGDIFLFPTHYEPFSNVVLEAMNYANAVITTRQNGAAEILDEAYIMQHPKDFSIVEKIDDLLFNEDRLSLIKEKNIEKVQKFSIERNVENTLRIIDDVLEK
ncbi:MAG: glycosyl transferase [Epsilonproteobacteria bacterium (ex Lamellibrachia satsuma)]|nr:MAG: glycosyl transferase [Epsilonproteobacteria bacterium (ex Lamellibrachia satsuma)]